MYPDLMAFEIYPLRQIGMLLSLAAQYEKGGLDPMLLQQIKQLGSIPRIRPIIKGKGDPGRRLPFPQHAKPAYSRYKKGERHVADNQEQNQQGSAKHQLLHGITSLR